MGIYLHILRRDLLLAIRHRAELINPLLFFVLVVVLFPLGIGTEQKILSSIAPAIVWIAALLSALLSLDHIFRSDMEDGSLEQMIISTQPTSLIVLAKITAHWMTTGLLITLVGTPILSAIGSIGVALTVGLRRGGIILSLLVLPLYVPVLIFASQTVSAANAGVAVSASLALLAALLMLAMALSPWATAAALRMSVS